MLVRWFAFLAVVALSASGARAQAVARADTVALSPGGVVPLPAGAIPGSIGVAVYDGTAFRDLPASAVAVDAAGRLTLVPPPDSLVVLRVSYRVLADPPAARARLPSADSLRAAEQAARADTSGAGPRAAPAVAPVTPTAIRTTGSITRGVVAGTDRDASITSALRLELAGEVAPGVRLTGSLTDQNTPVLPEGTTTRLSDLDRVFVAVESRRVTARLGDAELRLGGTAFAPLDRQVQGAVVEARAGAGGGAALRVVGAASAARGRFRTQEIAPVEGVQGPYRLQGDAGEAFVVVVPASERLRWDGQPLVRGSDYVIDYATGEITFTARRLVTRERRIVVDFEYTATGATRTLAAGAADATLGPATLGVRVLREADAASFLTDLGLSDDERDAIAAAGEGRALVPGWERVPFDPASPFVLYTRRDTTIGGIVTPIFEPATSASDAVYRVRFTQVAAGAGDYRRSAQATNGLFYEYVGPGQGDAIPFRLLPRPSARSLADAHAVVGLGRGVEVFAEGAWSVDDVNTLAADAADPGGAATAGLRVRDADALGGRLTADLRVVGRADAFRPFDRVRDADFATRWNLAQAGTGAVAALDTLGERSADAALAWTRGAVGLRAAGGALRLAGLTSRRASGAVTVGAPGADGPWGGAWLDVRAEGAATSGSGAFTSRVGTGEQVRASLAAGRRVGVAAPSLAVEHERRDQTAALDSLAGRPPSFAFTAVRPALSVALPVGTAEASAEWRAEAEPLAPGDPVTDAARVLTVDAAFALAPARTASLDARVGLRRRRWAEPFRLAGREDASSVAAAVTGRASALRGAADLTAGYEALTERTPLLQETYVLVGPDLGTHVWRDGEGEARPGEPDGVAQVDEFVPETTPLEGTYLRTFIPGQELLPTVGVGLTARLSVRPGRLAADDSPWRLVALRTALDVQEQTRYDDVAAVLALLPSALQRPGETVRGRFRVEQEAVLWPDHPTSGARLAGEHSTAISALAAGAESRLAQALRAEAYTAAGRVTARAEVAWERRRTIAEAFASRTYDLRGVRAEPRVTWTPLDGLTLGAGAFVADRRDALADGAGAVVFRLPADARWALTRRLVLVARAERAQVRLRGAISGLALFEFTDGRGAGTSYLWGLDLQGILSERFRASAVYDGRAPAGAPAIQTVRVQVSAVF